MDYFVFVGVGLFFTCLFWSAIKLQKQQSKCKNLEEENHSAKTMRF
jgi:hypothetical protein